MPNTPSMNTTVYASIRKLAAEHGVRHPKITISHHVYREQEKADAFLRTAAGAVGAVTAVRVWDDSEESALPKRYREMIRQARKMDRLLSHWDMDGIRGRALERAKHGKSITRGCGQCGARHEVDALISASCNLCGHDFLLTQRELDQLERSQAKLDGIEDALQAFASGEPIKSPAFIWRVSAGTRIMTLKIGGGRPVPAIDSMAPSGLSLSRPATRWQPKPAGSRRRDTPGFSPGF